MNFSEFLDERYSILDRSKDLDKIEKESLPNEKEYNRYTHKLLDGPKTDKAKAKKSAPTVKSKKIPQRRKAQSERNAKGVDKVFSAYFESSMNFTEFKEAITKPLYEVEGEVPKCPPGYKFDAKQLMCVPKTAKDKTGSGQQVKDLKPSNGTPYNVWGRTGMNGDGYAWEEPPTSNDKVSTMEEAKPTAKKKPTLTDRVKALEKTKRKKQETDRKKKATQKKKALAKPPITVTNWDD